MMTHGTYYIVNETTEDRFDETDTLENAIRIASRLVKECREPVSIEHDGLVIRQFVVNSTGSVEDVCVR